MDNNLKITIKDLLYKHTPSVFNGRIFYEPLYDNKKYEETLIQNIIYKYFESVDSSLTKGYTFDEYPSNNPKIRKEDIVILDNTFFNGRICTGGTSSKDSFTLYFLDGGALTLKYKYFTKIEIKFDPNKYFAKDLGYNVLNATVKGSNEYISHAVAKAIRKKIHKDINKERRVNNNISRERVRNTCIFYLDKEIDKQLITLKEKMEELKNTLKEDNKVLKKLEKYNKIYEKLYSDSIKIKRIIYEIEIKIAEKDIKYYNNDIELSDFYSAEQLFSNLYTINKIINLIKDGDEEKIKKFKEILKEDPIYYLIDDKLNNDDEDLNSLYDLYIKKMRDLLGKKFIDNFIFVELDNDSIKERLYNEADSDFGIHIYSLFIFALYGKDIITIRNYIY